MLSGQLNVGTVYSYFLYYYLYNINLSFTTVATRPSAIHGESLVVLCFLQSKNHIVKFCRCHTARRCSADKLLKTV